MESFRSLVSTKKAALKRGFTLIEMLVVLGIIVVITSIVITGESSFDNSFFLTNTAYDVALTVRQAQSYGLSSQAVGSVQNAGYGIQLSQATPTKYIFYADTDPASANVTPADKPGDSYYTVGSDALIQKYTFTGGYKFTKFCMHIKTGSPTAFCHSITGQTPAETLDIAFSRPNSDVSIIWTNSSGGQRAGTKACFTITSADNSQSRYVYVSGVGQISVSATCDASTVQ
jgi:prepilin-type N-terminal cleavage/methylation domain-containing protein